MSRILVVDDDPGLLTVCRARLGAMGHELRTVATGKEALVDASLEPPDVIVLDLGLPDMDGLEVCRAVRTSSQVPIIILSADGSEDRKVEAFDQGANDYMTKPFGMRELNARLKLVLQHWPTGSEDSSELTIGPIHFDFFHCEASLDGKPLDLTPKEFDFLAYLGRNAGKICTRRMILETVWGSAYAEDSHYLRVYVYRLRRKLNDQNGDLLQNVPALGYRLALPSE